MLRKDSHQKILFLTIDDSDASQPRRLKFDTQAQELFVEWVQDLETKLRSDELHPALASHLAGYYLTAFRAIGCVTIFVKAEELWTKQ